MKNENGRQVMMFFPVKYSSTARDGWASTHSHQWKGGKKIDSHGIWCACGCVSVCVCVCACVRICLHVSMSYLWVHLRHWAAGYAALKGCVSAAMSFSFSSLSLSHVQILFCLCLYHSPSWSVCVPLSALYHNWFQKDKAKCWRIVSFTAFHVRHREWPYAIGEGSWLALAVLWT